MKAKSLKILVIKEICSWLPPGLNGRKVCIAKNWIYVVHHINLYAYIGCMYEMQTVISLGHGSLGPHLYSLDIGDPWHEKV